MADGTRSRRAKLVFLMAAGAIGMIFLAIGAYQLVSFTDTVAFCGLLCHNVMYPEYTAYQASPHSRVQCVQCHVGSGAGYLVRSKISGIPLVFSTITGTYDRPIPTPVKNLRPARETCEQCHRPERFAGDIVLTHTTYLADRANTAKVDTRVLRVGGGEAGTAKGIHWHISAQVYYLPLDEKRSEIGWVEVITPEGKSEEFIDPTRASEITPERIEKQKRLMDCVDCHNRATHIYSSPEDLIDTAMAEGRIDTSLPYIKKEGAAALDPPSASLEAAYSRVDAIKDFFRNSYPAVYASKGQAIDAAIVQLKEVARLTTFPDMKVNWNTYADNIGHQNSPGCLRCHGRLVATTGASQGQVVQSACETCHFTLTPSITAGPAK